MKFQFWRNKKPQDLTLVSASASASANGKDSSRTAATFTGEEGEEEEEEDNVEQDQQQPRCMTVRTLKESLQTPHRRTKKCHDMRQAYKKEKQQSYGGSMSSLTNETQSSNSSGGSSSSIMSDLSHSSLMVMMIHQIEEAEPKEKEASSSSQLQQDTLLQSQHFQRKVQFTDVHVKYYVMTIGDSPSVTEGCPLTLEWEPIGISQASVDEFERVRQPQRRDYEDIWLNSKTRLDILLDAGHSREEIDRNVSSQRQQGPRWSILCNKVDVPVLHGRTDRIRKKNKIKDRECYWRVK